MAEEHRQADNRCVPRDEDCFVCHKHRPPGLMPGGPIHEDDLVIVSHLSPGSPGQSQEVYLGHHWWNHADTPGRSPT